MRLGLVGNIDRLDGIGAENLTLLRVFTRLGLEVEARGVPSENWQDAHPEALVQRGYRNWMPDIEIFHSVPEYARAIRRLDNFVYWGMWHTTKVPQNHLTVAAAAKHVVVPSQFVYDIFRNAGVETPMSIIPYAHAGDTWPLLSRAEKRPLTFLQYGRLTATKAPDLTIRAFQRAFPAIAHTHDVRLIVATRDNYWEGISPSSIPYRNYRDPRIEIANRQFSHSELLELCAAADVGLALSRGEGLPATPVQMALTGMPVIISTNSGAQEYLAPDTFYEVPPLPEMIPSEYGGEWYEPDIDAAAQQMRAIYENRAEATRRGLQTAAHLREHFSLDTLTQNVAGLLTEQGVFNG